MREIEDNSDFAGARYILHGKFRHDFDIHNPKPVESVLGEYHAFNDQHTRYENYNYKLPILNVTMQQKAVELATQQGTNTLLITGIAATPQPGDQVTFRYFMTTPKVSNGDERASTPMVFGFTLPGSRAHDFAKDVLENPNLLEELVQVSNFGPWLGPGKASQRVKVEKLLVAASPIPDSGHTNESIRELVQNTPKNFPTNVCQFNPPVGEL